MWKPQVVMLSSLWLQFLSFSSFHSHLFFCIFLYSFFVSLWPMLLLLFRFVVPIKNIGANEIYYAFRFVHIYVCIICKESVKKRSASNGFCATHHCSSRSANCFLFFSLLVVSFTPLFSFFSLLFAMQLSTKLNEWDKTKTTEKNIKKNEMIFLSLFLL